MSRYGTLSILTGLLVALVPAAVCAQTAFGPVAALALAPDRTALDRAKAALATVDAMLRFDPGFTDRLRAIRGGIPAWREWAGSNQRPATAWPLSQLLAARLDLAMLTRDRSAADALVRELDAYRYDGAYAPAHASRRVGASARYYDDNAWIGLDLLQAHRQTGDRAFLSRAVGLVSFMEGGIQSGGGILWVERSGRPSLNSCVNAPAMQFFLGLYEATREERYRDDALRVETVLNGTLRRSDGLYSDNVALANHGERDETIWSYNQGASIGANLQLSNDAADPASRKRALALARGTADAILRKLQGERDWLWKQPPAFNCVLFRNLVKLDAIVPDPRVGTTLAGYLDRAWREARRPSNGALELGGIGRYGADATGITLIDQSAFGQMFSLAAMSRAQRLMLY